MRHNLAFLAAFALLISFPAAAAVAEDQASSTQAVAHFTGDELLKDAKIGIADARSIALKAHPGKITDEELEAEKGGTGLRYSFDIKRGEVVQEVGVDAKTGKVLENSEEGPNPD